MKPDKIDVKKIVSYFYSSVWRRNIVVPMTCFTSSLLFLILQTGCTATYADPKSMETDATVQEMSNLAPPVESDNSNITRPKWPTAVTGGPEEQPEPQKPKFKDLSPLDTERVTISFVEENYRQVFQILARAAGLNLVLDPDLESLVADYRLTAEYQEFPVRSVLDATCNILNVTWREQYSTLFIEPYLSETIHLDFIIAINNSSFSVGGDVLGGSDSSEDDTSAIESPLTGRFEVTGEINDTVTDIYTNIEDTVGQLLEDDGTFILNRQTGTLMVRGRPQLIGQIKGYLGELQKKYSRQVLIEAQIIEVDLNQSQQLGVDWRNFSILTSNEPIQDLAQTIVNITGDSSGTDSFYNLTIDHEDFSMSTVFRALKQYGDLKVLSNPRLKAMNGQSALISVGQSVSYLRSLTRTTEGTGADSTSELSTEIGAIFDGILLGVTPIIKNSGSVALHIVPIKSELVALDQQQLGEGDNVRLTFPTVNLREISTIVDIKPGNVVVLGGLIMERDQEGVAGLPILSDLPVFGYLFKEKRTEKQKVELVVILQVNVID